MQTAVDPTPAPDAREDGARRFRPELQALRALAVTLVVVYHFAPRQLTGGYTGVDVFFVISGFLMTAHLHRELRATGRIRVARFYARRIRRLLPAALLVLAATLAGTIALVPPTLWSEFGRQTAASALYGENWALAGNATQYLASSSDASPLQHFWSLSVEEQFYLVWPALLMLTATLAARFRLRQGRAMLAVVLLVIAASLVASVALTAYAPAAAYFLTWTRVWELAVGGLLWRLGDQLLVPPRLRSVMSWTGLVMIVLTAVTFTSTTTFPGVAALVPVLGASLVIVAGEPRSRWSPARLMNLKPVQYLGKISYSLYLWHWPLIVIVPFAVTGEFRPPLRAAILVASVVLAVATKHLVEDRFQHGSRTGGKGDTPRAYGWVAAGAVLIAVPALLVAGFAQARVAEAGRQFAIDKTHLPAAFGAEAARIEEDGTTIPPALAAINDWVREDASGTACQQEGEFESVTTCHFGPSTGKTHVALVGDSHAGQWIPAVRVLAEQRGWRITTYLRAGCPLSLTYSTRATDSGGACIHWVDAVLGDLETKRYDAVLVSAFTGLSYSTTDGQQGVADGMAAAWRRVAATGSTIVALRDPPDPQAAGIPDVPTCVYRNAAAPQRCDVDRALSVLQDPQVGAAAEVPNARVVDLTEVFCPDRCDVVQGGALMYRDGNHLTATYAATLANALGRALGVID